MALTERTPFRIAQRFWNGWTQAIPAHLVLAVAFTFAFNPIATTPLIDTTGIVPIHVAITFPLSTFLVFLSWAVSAHSMRTGYTLHQTLLSLFPLAWRATLATVLFLLLIGSPLVQQNVQNIGLGLSIVAGCLALGFFLYLEWSMMEHPMTTPTIDLPTRKTPPFAPWREVIRTWRFLRSVWTRIPLALASIATGLFALSLLLLPLTSILSILWPTPPLWAAVFFVFFVFSSIPSLAAAALAVSRTLPKTVA